MFIEFSQAQLQQLARLRRSLGFVSPQAALAYALEEVVAGLEDDDDDAGKDDGRDDEDQDDCDEPQEPPSTPPQCEPSPLKLGDETSKSDFGEHGRR